MKLTEVRDAMYRELTPLLPGWKLVKKAQAFVRPIPGGEQRIVVGVVDYKPEYRISLALATRLEAAEELFHRSSGIPAAVQASSFTAVTQLAYFYPNQPEPKQFAVHDEAEIAAAVSAMAPVLREHGLPLLDRTRTVEALDAAMNGDDRAFDTSERTMRALHGLAVAHLARNPHFDELVARYQAEMIRYPDEQKQRVANLVTELTKDPP
jgi:hypothetical protein